MRMRRSKNLAPGGVDTSGPHCVSRMITFLHKGLLWLFVYWPVSEACECMGGTRDGW